MVICNDRRPLGAKASNQPGRSNPAPPVITAFEQASSLATFFSKD